MLATMRRKRFNEFALGGFLASLAGSAQTVADFLDNRVVPSYGHLAEVAVAIFFFALVIGSLFQLSEPTSRDLLTQTFPEMARRDRFIRRVRAWWKRICEDVSIPL